jgi:uncharacterized protein YegP (UPF0339 family)
MHHPKFVIKQGSSDEYSFHLTASNSEIILVSQRYGSRESAENGVASVKTNAPHDEQYRRRTSKDEQRYFVLKAANGEVIGTSEMYRADAGMEGGIASVKRGAAVAEVEG